MSRAQNKKKRELGARLGVQELPSTGLDRHRGTKGSYGSSWDTRCAKKLRSEGATRRIHSFWSINRGQADNLDLIRSPNYMAWSRISARREAEGGSVALCPYPQGGPGTRGAGDGTRTRRAPPSCLPRVLASCPATPWWSQDAVGAEEGQKPLRAPAREPCSCRAHLAPNLSTATTQNHFSSSCCRRLHNEPGLEVQPQRGIWD